MIPLHYQALVGVGVLLLSAYAHEQGHALMLKRYGQPAKVVYGWRYWSVPYEPASLTLYQERAMLRAGIGAGLAPIIPVFFYAPFFIITFSLILFGVYLVGCRHDIRRLKVIDDQLEKIDEESA